MRIDTALWNCWFRSRRSAPDWLVSRWNSSAFAHIASIAVLARYESQQEKRLAADSNHLHHFEFSVHSQNGEDGIITEIFRRIGSGHRVLVEIGAADGEENCTAELVSQGWSGIWIEGDPERVTVAREGRSDRSLRVVEAYVDRESILSVLQQQSLAAEPDLLVIDVDGNDYWIWQSVSTRYAPRVVVIEYNAAVGSHLEWVMRYDSGHRWDETAWQGAGLAALVRLGERNGYELVGCDSQGVNAFFVRHEFAHHFGSGTTRERWVPPRYVLPYGHPVRQCRQFDSSALPLNAGAKITLRVRRLRPFPLRPRHVFYFNVEVRNMTSVPIGSSREWPFQLAYWWIAEDGGRVDEEIERCSQVWRCDPNRRSRLICRVTSPECVGSYSLVVCLVQENVRWLEEGQLEIGNWTVN